MSILDVSVYQGSIDWAAMAKDGVNAAWCRIADGSARDSQWSKARVDAMRKAGVRVGTYMYFRPGQGGAHQADMAWKLCKDAGHGANGDGGFALDLESGGNEGVGFGKAARAAEEFIDRWLELAGYYPIIYGNLSYLRSIVGAATPAQRLKFARCTLWMAWPVERPVKDPPKPDIWARAALVQYSWKGRKGGKSPLDMDYAPYGQTVLTVGHLKQRSGRGDAVDHTKQPAAVDSKVHRKLDLGDTGEDVRRFQKAANVRFRRRLLTDRVAEDGKVGPQTLKAASTLAWVLGLPEAHRTAADEQKTHDPFISQTVQLAVRVQYHFTKEQEKLASERLGKLKAVRRAAALVKKDSQVQYRGIRCTVYVRSEIQGAEKHGWKGSCTSGLRTYSEQSYLYQLYLSGRGNPAYPPGGASKHGTWNLGPDGKHALDLVGAASYCSKAPAGDWWLGVPGESWHAEERSDKVGAGA